MSQESYVHDRVRQIVAHLNILKKNIKIDIIEANKERARQHVIDLALLVQEAHFQNGRRSQLDVVSDLLEMQIERISEATDKEALENVVERVTNLFAENKYKNDLSSYSRCRRFRDSTETWEATTPLRNIVKNERALNVLSYDTPISILRSKQLNGDMLNTYGIAINTDYTEDDVKNIAYGTGGNSNITNNAFDVVMLMPDSSAHYTPIGFRNDIIPKVEFMAISSCLKYLRTEGLICLTIPYTRLDSDLCSYLSRNFGNIRMIKGNDILVEFYGIKKSEKVLDVEAYNYLRGVYKNFRKLGNKLDSTYQLPQQIAVIQHFRGSRITDKMLNNVKEKSNVLDRVMDTANFIDDLSNHKPLLPFNTGQVGLVLASGCLDGVVHEDKEHCHLIKGRVERKTVVKKGRSNSNDEITVYHSVQINALTPDGKLIEIS